MPLLSGLIPYSVSTRLFHLCFAAALTWLAAASHGDDWPHWRGPARDGSSKSLSGSDAGAWKDKAGPVVVWSESAAEGSSSPIIVDGKVYTLGLDGDHDILQCKKLATGKTVWSQQYPAPRYGRHAIGDQGFYSGPSATPEYDAQTGYLFTIGCDGALNAWDTRDSGRRAWNFNLYERYEAPQRPKVTEHENSHRDYGYTAAPLALSDYLLVEAGSDKQGTVVALDKKSGRHLWGSELRDAAGHSGGLVPMQVAGKPGLVVFTAQSIALISLDKSTPGKTLATRAWTTHYANNMATPVVVDGDVIVSTKWNHLTARLRPGPSGGWTTVWESKLHSNVCSPVVVGERLYFAGSGLYCLNVKTGEKIWHGGKFSDASSLIACADGRLITWANHGDLGLVELAPGKEFKQLASHSFIKDDMAWPHPALAGGRLVCRARSGKLLCFKLIP